MVDKTSNRHVSTNTTCYRWLDDSIHLLLICHFPAITVDRWEWKRRASLFIQCSWEADVVTAWVLVILTHLLCLQRLHRHTMASARLYSFSLGYLLTQNARCLFVIVISFSGGKDSVAVCVFSLEPRSPWILHYCLQCLARIMVFNREHGRAYLPLSPSVFAPVNTKRS